MIYNNLKGHGVQNYSICKFYPPSIGSFENPTQRLIHTQKYCDRVKENQERNQIHKERCKILQYNNTIMIKIAEIQKTNRTTITTLFARKI